jgi:sensor histidine kinase YesM
MLPMLAFLNLTLTGLWKKIAFIFLLSTAIYPVAVFVLNATRIMPVGLSERGFNYVLSLSMTILTSMLALQPAAKNRFAIIARIHMVLWSFWGLSAAIRLLVLNMDVYVNIEYRLVYGFTLISLTFFGIFIFARNFNELQKREYAMSIKTESLMQNYEQLNAHFHEINRLKHDMRNHLSMLNIFLKDSRFKEAQRYLEKYADEVGEITEAAFHENYIINAVAHDLSHRGHITGANVEFYLKASPRNISEPDLISLLTNIIDNALEACALIPEGTERLIRLSVTRREPYLAIVCENSYAGIIGTAQNGEGIRSNKSETGHGYGLKTIERIAAIYDGMVELSHDNNIFTITVALKDKE